jgi:hypothetical protein
MRPDYETRLREERADTLMRPDEDDEIDDQRLRLIH